MSAPEPSEQNLNIGGVLGLAIATFRRHWLSLVLVALVPILAGEIFGVWLPAQLTGVLSLPLVGMVAPMVSLPIQTAMTALVTGWAALLMIQDQGGARATLATLASRAPLLLLIGVISALLILVGLAALIIPGVIVALALMPVAALAAAEPGRPDRIVRRSFALTGTQRGAILGLCILLGLGTGMLQFALRMIGSTIDGQPLESALLGLPAQPGAIIAFVISSMVGALASSTVAAALYMRLVQIKDGGHDASTAEVFA